MLDLKPIIEKALEAAFRARADLCKSFQTLNGFGIGMVFSGAPGGPPYVPPSCIVLDYQPWEVDGVQILAGDKKCLIREKDMALEFEPEPGIKIKLLSPPQTYLIIAASLDTSGSLWTIQMRLEAP